MHLVNGSNSLHFFYDAQNKPGVVLFNGTAYSYLYNLQGDVIALLDSASANVVDYKYDTWGKPISKTGSLAATLGTLNPFRYRGYVFDEETGLYYLRSRYYNPIRCRFINADTMLNKVGELRCPSPYAYCLNSPVNRTDYTGRESIPDQDLGYPAYIKDNFFEGDIVLGTTNPLPFTGEPFSYAYGYNGNGEQYERWFGPNGFPEMDIHYSHHGNPKLHPNPHKHVWEQNLMVNGIMASLRTLMIKIENGHEKTKTMAGKMAMSKVCYLGQV